MHVRPHEATMSGSHPVVIHVEAAAVGFSRALERNRVQGDLFVRRLCNAGGAGCIPANAADRRAAAARSPEHQGLTPAINAPSCFQICAEKGDLSRSCCASHSFCHADCCDRICDISGCCCMIADAAKKRSIVKSRQHQSWVMSRQSD